MNYNKITSNVQTIRQYRKLKVQSAACKHPAHSATFITIYNEHATETLVLL